MLLKTLLILAGTLLAMLLGYVVIKRVKGRGIMFYAVTMVGIICVIRLGLHFLLPALGLTITMVQTLGSLLLDLMIMTIAYFAGAAIGRRFSAKQYLEQRAHLAVYDDTGPIERL